MLILATQDEAIQVDTLSTPNKQKSGVYESIPNDKRCELIRKVFASFRALVNSWLEHNSAICFSSTIPFLFS